MADPAETAPPADQPVEREPRRFDRKTLLPVLLIAAVIIVPVAVWAVGSGGSDDSLRVEQYVSYYTGGPEIVLAIPRKYNNMAETGNKANVVVVCLDSGGKQVLRANADWPFIEEPGYDLPHVHQPVSDAQLKAVATCTVEGMKHHLTGALRRTRST
jgi:hypothetical protein